MSTTTTAPIAVITGGSRGLGRNAALALAADGSDIALTYRSQADETAAVVAEIHKHGRRAHALQLDVADADSFAAFAQLKQVLAGWGPSQFDALVNNAGTGLHASFADTTPAQFDGLVAIHLKGPSFLRDNAQVDAMVSSVTALGRPGLPDDIGPAVAALLAPGIAWINAQRIEVSGGMLI
ncbi:hypothetical protein A7D16_08430 [Xanthomonas nasturtii]|uniref:SDR family NAD(P)-dependent oxidoreductase n=1 Tax=Xanthomonas nasturtii TaxID=1843581 RepID=UPI0007E3174B|nr:SDR family NAD(P)-dependent oxidoreductase [Xanthomonas nasturtii]MCL1536094.1 SDR family NAD(P)-dependent oxidoreductase [Xanthomonas nasturtii]MCL1544786.1 SDR family NAD(P)-dependent oxidoreductase [Xanthomonas nasturtii]OAX89092.1 hypothetical protein A7D16_08430 [Xanthomonas nasturtii]WVL55869.1 SDR family NAD(P)-dependent oxidoreductase [Xanthomonas nasturtii]